MNRYLTGALCLGLAAFAAGCETVQDNTVAVAAAAQKVAVPLVRLTDEVDLKLVVPYTPDDEAPLDRRNRPKNADKLKNRAQILEVLQALPLEDIQNCKNLTKEKQVKPCLKELRQAAKNNNDIAIFNGLGGSRVASLLPVLKNVDDGSSGVSVKGQIRDFCLDAKGNEDMTRPGFAYAYDTSDPAIPQQTAGYLRLCVTVKTKVGNNTVSEYFEIVASNAATEERCVGAHGDPRCATNGSNDGNVFPVAAKATGLEVERSQTEPPQGVVLDWKLYAAGTNIKVVRYGLDGKYYSSGDSGLPARVARVFRPDPDACIDMMFVGKPPQNAGALIPGFNYCLGRCKNPPVVNTL